MLASYILIVERIWGMHMLATSFIVQIKALEDLANATERHRLHPFHPWVQRGQTPSRTIHSTEAGRAMQQGFDLALGLLSLQSQRGKKRVDALFPS